MLVMLALFGYHATSAEKVKENRQDVSVDDETKTQENRFQAN